MCTSCVTMEVFRNLCWTGKLHYSHILSNFLSISKSGSGVWLFQTLAKPYHQEPYNEPIHQEVYMSRLAWYTKNILYKINHVMFLLNKNMCRDINAPGNRTKWAIPSVTSLIISWVASVGVVVIKGFNSYLNHKRNSAMSNAVKWLYENDKLFHDRMLVMQKKLYKR